MLRYHALLLFVSASILFAPAPATAEDEPEICKQMKEIGGQIRSWRKSSIFTQEENCRSAYWSAFKPKGLADILDTARLAAYRGALDKSDCPEAERILRHGFAAAHPSAPSVVANEEDLEEWRVLPVARYFSDLYLCTKLAEIARYQAEIDRQGFRADPYRGFERSLPRGAIRRLKRPHYSRHHAVQALISSLPANRNPKIGLALLKLSIEGRALKFTRLHEMYLAHRLASGYGVKHSLVSEVLNRPLAGDEKDLFERIKKDGWIEGLPVFAE